MTKKKVSNKVSIIGSGFASLAAAITLADDRFDVTILEKNSSPGGRARVFQAEGFTFDMGPSWYWMPDVFEDFFARFGKKISDYYDLVRLDPSYTVFFGKDDSVQLPANMSEFEALFESLESGSTIQLREFLKQAKHKYQVGMSEFVTKPSLKLTEFADKTILSNVLYMDLFKSFSKHARKFFKNEKILQIIEFPVLFLGATPENTPALYSLMNYADIALGTWYPMGGMHKIIEAMVSLATELGVKFEYNTEVLKIEVQDNKASKIMTNQGEFESDIFVAGADYHHVETKLLAPELRNYDTKYWESRIMSPSSLIFYLGINKRLKNLTHHNLFFDTDFPLHAKEIYETPIWPTQPLFYVSAPSQTDDSIAPEGCENIFILIPVAPDLDDNEETREKYYNMVMDRLESLTEQKIRESVIYKKSYAHNDFKNDYHAFKGNAYGLANTLMQTAIFKPSIKNKKIDNLYYTGQLTVPGPGVPPSLISGQVVADQIKKKYH
ncbi:MAG: phytoene desaturase [Candidatus Sericytochromatia bacterium]|nr:phytoene desaturase [Candidatus Sericytochromatia bacterium]